LGKVANGAEGPYCQASETEALHRPSESLSEEIPLSRLATECGLSDFARAFRHSTGVSPHRWLLKHRVDHARELLSDRALSLTDVALSCGFADQSHFTRLFTVHSHGRDQSRCVAAR